MLDNTSTRLGCVLFPERVNIGSSCGVKLVFYASQQETAMSSIKNIGVSLVFSVLQVSLFSLFFFSFFLTCSLPHSSPLTHTFLLHLKLNPIKNIKAISPFLSPSQQSQRLLYCIVLYWFLFYIKFPTNCIPSDSETKLPSWVLQRN